MNYKLNNAFFIPFYSRGLATARDAWCYNSSSDTLITNIKDFIEFYNQQRIDFIKKQNTSQNLKLEEFVNFDSKRVTWNRGLKNDLQRNKEIIFHNESVFKGMYRPFFKQNVYFSKELNDMVYQLPKLFPTLDSKNSVICVSGTTNNFSVIIANVLPDLHFNGDTQCFPLYHYEERQKSSPTLFDDANESEYIRRDGVSDFILERAHKMYGNRVSKEDIFYFVYGILHSPEYRTRFANDLKKMLPRIPLVEEPNDFRKFSKAGRALAVLHINYEQVAPYEGVTVKGAETVFFRFEKMCFPAKDRKDTILYNSKITIENIPAKAYEYVVNGKSAIEWIMERYQVTIHKESGIKNDPNDWADEVGNPRYILDLLLSIINLSLKTVEIVESLPKLKFE